MILGLGSTFDHAMVMFYGGFDHVVTRLYLNLLSLCYRKDPGPSACGRLVTVKLATTALVPCGAASQPAFPGLGSSADVKSGT